ncbi:hypothetical protein PENSOL_c179G11597 [Penicillium solitum]|uniref:Uncharacterized protein n=1 Tax=Penicillium solitum TaxID=60172 RepID=A0A1V6Q1J5_9EURO|nr:hypothetical protein PENSOL_c179G11597 [Penicillium solitum]
MPRQQVRRREL